MRFELSEEQLTAAVDAAGLEDDVLHLDYSGRAMYGATCPAVYVDGFGDAAAFLAALTATVAEESNYFEAQEVVELARTTRTDGMGRGIVAYWPDLRVADGTIASERG